MPPQAGCLRGLAAPERRAPASPLGSSAAPSQSWRCRRAPAPPPCAAAAAADAVGARSLDAAHLSTDALPAAFDSLSAIFTTCCNVGAGETPLGRGLVALGDTAPGEPLLWVDRAGILCVSDEPGGAFGAEAQAEWQMLHGPLPPLLAGYLLSGSDNWFVRMTAWLLWLARNGSGPWALYTQLLPSEEQLSCLMNYRPHEAAELQLPALVELAERERGTILALHDRLYSAQGGELRGLKLADTPADTLWAAACVNSRSFSEQVGGEAVSLVVPCADMCNHQNKPRATYAYNPGSCCFEITAARPLQAGREVTISYGAAHKDSAQLMKDYGFVLPGNINDRLAFGGADVASQLSAPGAAAAPAAPPQLHSAGLAAAVESSDVAADVGGGAAEEVQAERRRQQAVLQSLKPFFRPGSGSQPLGEANLPDERRSVALLRAQCDAMMQGLPTTLETDEALLRGEGGDGAPLSARHRAAVAARLERKRLLRTAMRALDRYAAALA